MAKGSRSTSLWKRILTNSKTMNKAHEITSMNELRAMEVPNITVTFKGGYYNIFRGKREIYWIDEPRLKTEAQLLSWIIHLSAKIWWTTSSSRKLRKLFYKSHPKLKEVVFV